jgi:hypothetical protein
MTPFEQGQRYANAMKRTKKGKRIQEKTNITQDQFPNFIRGFLYERVTFHKAGKKALLDASYWADRLPPTLADGVDNHWKNVMGQTTKKNTTAHKDGMYHRFCAGRIDDIDDVIKDIASGSQIPLEVERVLWAKHSAKEAVLNPSPRRSVPEVQEGNLESEFGFWDRQGKEAQPEKMVTIQYMGVDVTGTPEQLATVLQSLAV